MSRKAFGKKLRIEQLEAKTLLAGDVFAAVFGGNLYITGDSDPNSIQMENGANPGEFTLQETDNGSINDGAVDEVHVFTGVTGDVYVNLKIGNDLFRIIDADLPDDLYVWGGDGDDALIIGIPDNDISAIPATVTIAGDVTFSGGDGADLLRMRDYSIGDDVTFIGAAGDDVFSMEFRHPNGVMSTVGDDVLVDTGHDDDDVLVEDVDIDGSLVISTTKGDDLVEVFDAFVDHSMLVSLGSGLNEVEMEVVDAGHSLTIVGSGTNDIELEEVTASHLVKIVTGSGDDVVELELITTATAIILTDGGADDVTITDSTIDLLFACLGSGDDVLAIEGADTDIGIALLFGGSGEDELVIDEDASIDLEWDFSFEV